MKILAITQARVSSSRLPGKILLPLGEGTVLDLHLIRILKSKLITKLVVATTHESGADEICRIATQNNCDYFKGDLDDVLNRFYQASLIEKPDYVIRLTSDCPLIDHTLIDDLIYKFQESNVDYAANCLGETLPDGMDVEIFSFKSLEIAWKEAKLNSEREHVTSYIRNCGKFKILPVDYSPSLGRFRLTLDTIEDYNLLKILVENVGGNASMLEYVSYIQQNPEVLEINSKFERNEGYQKSLKGDS